MISFGTNDDFEPVIPVMAIHRVVRGALIGLGSVLTIAALVPQTRWPMQNHLDILLGRWHQPERTDDEMPPPPGPKVVYPLQGTLAERVAALMLNEGSRGQICEIAEQSRDPKLLAIACRISCDRIYGLLPSYRFWNRARAVENGEEDVAKTVVRLSNLGEQTDPTNAFFPAMQAYACQALLDLPQRDSALAQGANCPTYNSYLLEDLNQQRTVAHQFRGYRGAFVDGYSLQFYDRDAIFLRQLNTSLESSYLPPSSPEAKKVLFKILWKTLQSRQTWATRLDLERLTLAAGQRMSAKYDVPESVQLLFGHSSVDPRIGLLGADLALNDLAPKMALAQERSLHRPESPDRRFIFGFSPASTQVLIACLLFLFSPVAYLGLSALTSKVVLPPSAAPLLFACSFGIYDLRSASDFADARMLPYVYGVYAILFALTFTRKLKWWIIGAAVATPLVAIAIQALPLTDSGGPFPAVPLVAFVIPQSRELWLEYRKKTPTSGFFPFLALGFWGWCLAFELGYEATGATYSILPAWLLALGLIGMVPAAVSAWQRITLSDACRRLASVCPTLVAVGMACYLGCIGFELWQNPKIERYLDTNLVQAQEIGFEAPNNARLLSGDVNQSSAR